MFCSLDINIVPPLEKIYDIKHKRGRAEDLSADVGADLCACLTAVRSAQFVGTWCAVSGMHIHVVANLMRLCQRCNNLLNFRKKMVPKGGFEPPCR
jgi:hypothetical protein